MFHDDLTDTHFMLSTLLCWRISKRVIQENKAFQIFRKIDISYPLIHRRFVCVSGGNCSLFGKFDVLFFLETPVLRFALLPYYRRNIWMKKVSYVQQTTLCLSRPYHFNFFHLFNTLLQSIKRIVLRLIYID